MRTSSPLWGDQPPAFDVCVARGNSITSHPSDKISRLLINFGYVYKNHHALFIMDEHFFFDWPPFHSSYAEVFSFDSWYSLSSCCCIINIVAIERFLFHFMHCIKIFSAFHWSLYDSYAEEDWKWSIEGSKKVARLPELKFFYHYNGSSSMYKLKHTGYTSLFIKCKKSSSMRVQSAMYKYYQGQLRSFPNARG